MLPIDWDRNVRSKITINIYCNNKQKDRTDSVKKEAIKGIKKP